MKPSQPKKKPIHDYARYSGLAFQMIAIILAGVYAGYRLDKYAGTSRPWFTALFAVLSVALSVYFSIRDLIK